MTTTHSDMIYHLALASDWREALAHGGSYRTSTLGVSLREQGFIHCSFAHQVQKIADLVYRDRPDVVLLAIDIRRLRSPVRVEVVAGGDAYPHIYGPLERTAVVGVTPLDRRPDGRLAINL